MFRYLITFLFAVGLYLPSEAQLLTSEIFVKHQIERGECFKDESRVSYITHRWDATIDVRIYYRNRSGKIDYYTVYGIKPGKERIQPLCNADPRISKLYWVGAVSGTYRSTIFPDREEFENRIPKR